MKPKFVKIKDRNHDEIADSLRKSGVEVSDFSEYGKYPDLLLWHKDVARWLEVKIPVEKGKRQPEFQAVQLKFISMTRMPVAFCDSVPSATAYALTGLGALTQKQKDAIAGLLIRNPDKKAFTCNEVTALLNA